MNEPDIKELAVKIKKLKRDALEVQQLSGGNHSVERNIARIQASIKMLEININDAVDIG